MPLIDGPANAVSYFAANAKSSSLRNKMKALALLDTASSDGGGAPARLAETRPRGLVHRDSKPISARSSQSSGGDDTVTPSLDHGNCHLGVFSEIGIGEEMLLPGDWPLSQVSLLSAEGVGTGLGRDLVPPPGAVENHATGWAHISSKADPFQRRTYAEGPKVQMGMWDMIQVRLYDDTPTYFNEYHDRLLLKAEGPSRMGGPYQASSQVSVLHRMCRCGRIFACEDDGPEGSFTCGLHDL